MLFAQEQNNKIESEFLLDAVVFRGDSIDKSRVDVFIVVPYKTLEFINSKDKFGSKYEIFIDIYNTDNSESYNDKISRSVIADDYFISRGGSGEYDFNQKIFYLIPGNYKLTVTVIDKISEREYKRSRRLTVLNYSNYDFALSGILLLSSIEEDNGKYKITPHISDEIGRLSNGFFTFFEVYSNNIPQDAKFIYRILEGDEVKTESEIITKLIDKNPQQEFIKIPSQKKLATGEYTLRIIALNETVNEKSQINEENYLAVAQRSIKVVHSISGNILSNLDEAIQQMIYIAYQDEIDEIKDAPNFKEKERRFMEFWKSKDPSPSTEINEAFEEYYTRIQYANSNFKSYTKGWMTDKGMVYVIYGPPYNVEKQNSYTDNRAYEVWRYRNNREFIFIDNSGFGDFRLYRPATVSEKYEYGRN